MEPNTQSTIRNYTVAFYNLENLFDTKNDPKTLDDDFTEDSDRHWNEARFRKKLKKLGRVISSIGYPEIEHPPVLVGVAEVENQYVLEELVASKFLKKKNYGVVHFDSPDERGIDTGLLYRKDYVSVIHTETKTVYLETETGQRDYTRDILYVHGKLEKQEVHILVNHWPSRRAGAELTSSKRVTAAQHNRVLIEQIKEKDPAARILVMGDFNDDPKSESISALKSTDLYNPMELLLTRYEGSLSYRGQWNLFDQILISSNFFESGNSFKFKEAKIFNPKQIREFKGRNKGNPFRTFMGKKYLGGMSDHFPVYTIFSMND